MRVAGPGSHKLRHVSSPQTPSLFAFNSSRTSPSIASSKRAGKCRGMSRKIKTKRVLVSSDGQRSRNSGGEKTCCTPCTTAGRPGISSMLTTPFIRTNRSPQCSARACSHKVKASAGSGRSRRSDSVSMPSACRARVNGDPAGRSGSMPSRTARAIGSKPAKSDPGRVSIASERGANGFRASMRPSNEMSGRMRSTLLNTSRSAIAIWRRASG
jgi:hypothetical protein